MLEDEIIEISVPKLRLDLIPANEIVGDVLLVRTEGFWMDFYSGHGVITSLSILNVCLG